MRKILALMLSVMMVLTSMSFSVVSAANAARGIKIEISQEDQEVYAGETVTVTVVLEGVDMANAEWVINYDPTHFELKDTGLDDAKTGVIEDCDFLTDGTVYDNGHVLATYTFEALAQDAKTVSNISVSDAHAYTYIESADAAVIDAETNNVDVTILMRKYQVTELLDGEEFDELSFANDNGEHKFTVDVKLDDGSDADNATVTYKVNGQDVNEVVLDGEGDYEIKYTITPDDGSGYEEVTKTITITITAPKFVVEVNVGTDVDDDYVAGKKLVLVYTNTPGVYFEYRGNAMVDVSVSDYLYNDVTYYEYTYAFVTDANDGTTLQDFEDNVDYCYDLDFDVIDTYDYDMNFNGTYELQDVTTAYGVLNVNADYFANVKYQKHILKADANNTKRVDEDLDVNGVVNKVFE